MNERLKNLYKTIILRHNNEPFFFEKKENLTHVLQAYNPICGDKFQLFFEIKNGVIEDLSFHGFGCAISKASTSVLVKNLKNKKIGEALLCCQEFQNIVDGKTKNASEEMEAFSAATDFPGRLKCATLSWDEMMKFLESQII